MHVEHTYRHNGAMGSLYSLVEGSYPSIMPSNLAYVDQREASLPVELPWPNPLFIRFL